MPYMEHMGIRYSGFFGVRSFVGPTVGSISWRKSPVANPHPVERCGRWVWCHNSCHFTGRFWEAPVLRVIFSKGKTIIYKMGAYGAMGKK